MLSYFSQRLRYNISCYIHKSSAGSTVLSGPLAAAHEDEEGDCSQQTGTPSTRNTYSQLASQKKRTLIVTAVNQQ